MVALGDHSRVELGVWPTPLTPSPLLAQALERDVLWTKRDDLSGFSWGGNKVRAAEFLLGDALAAGATELVLAGGPSSNFAAVMATAGRSRGLRVHQVSYGCEPTRRSAALSAGRTAGASVVFTGSSDRSLMEDLAGRLAADRALTGEAPYVIPRGGASDVGTLGFLAAAIELERQADLTEGVPTTIVLPVGSGGSAAGLIAGLARSERDWTVHAISVSRDPKTIEEVVVNLAARCAASVGIDLTPADIQRRLFVHDGRGSGFGELSTEIAMLADRVEAATGLLIDPTYNAKTLAWMHAANPGGLSPDRPILYWHTGGVLGSVDRMLSTSEPVTS